MQVAQEYLQKSLSLADIVIKYGVSVSSIEKWCRIAREQGYEALADTKTRGRPPKDMTKKSKTKEPLTELEQLRKRNAYLEAENDLLKKVKALVEEREARDRKIGRGPSKS